MPYKDPAKRAEQKKKWADENPAYAQKYREDNKEKRAKYIRDYHLKRTYGITQKDYDDLFLKQNGKCKICSKEMISTDSNTHIDHCHTTGKIRGLLCSRCNQAIGLFDEDLEKLSAAISYLSKNTE